MQRFAAIITLWAFLLVTSLPVLAVAPVCAHAAMANDDTCATACHDAKPALTPDDMDMSEFSMPLSPSVSDGQAVAAHEAGHKKPPHCRIECGCGCNNSPDTFPLTLSPHLPAIDEYEIEIISSRTTVTPVSRKTISLTPPDSPPPRNS